MIVAPFIVAAALLAVTWRLASASGAAAERRRRSGIDPRLHQRLVDFADAVLNVRSLAPEDLVVMPEAIRRDGERLLADVEENRRAKARAQRRLTGY